MGKNSQLIGAVLKNIFVLGYILNDSVEEYAQMSYADLFQSLHDMENQIFIKVDSVKELLDEKDETDEISFVVNIVEKEYEIHIPLVSKITKSGPLKEKVSTELLSVILSTKLKASEKKQLVVRRFQIPMVPELADCIECLSK